MVKEEYLKVIHLETGIKIKLLKGKISKRSDVITKLYKNSESPKVINLSHISLNVVFMIFSSMIEFKDFMDISGD